MERGKRFCADVRVRRQCGGSNLLDSVDRLRVVIVLSEPNELIGKSGVPYKPRFHFVGIGVASWTTAFVSTGINCEVAIEKVCPTRKPGVLCLDLLWESGFFRV